LACFYVIDNFNTNGGGGVRTLVLRKPAGENLSGENCGLLGDLGCQRLLFQLPNGQLLQLLSLRRAHPHLRRLADRGYGSYFGPKRGLGGLPVQKECLESPYENSGNPQYFNDPINKTTQNPSNIKLPVVFPGNRSVAGKTTGNSLSMRRRT